MPNAQAFVLQDMGRSKGRNALPDIRTADDAAQDRTGSACWRSRDVGTMYHTPKHVATLGAPRRVRRASLALALSRLEREHVALLLAICELESPQSADDTNSPDLRQALMPMLRDDLRQTQHALALAARGAYGMCEECHTPIGARHLEIKPALTRCPACAAAARRSLTLR